MTLKWGKFFFLLDDNRSWHLWCKLIIYNSKMGYSSIIFEVLIKRVIAAEVYMVCYWYGNCLTSLQAILSLLCAIGLYFHWFVAGVCSDTSEIRVPSSSPTNTVQTVKL